MKGEIEASANFILVLTGDDVLDILLWFFICKYSEEKEGELRGKV